MTFSRRSGPQEFLGMQVPELAQLSPVTICFLYSSWPWCQRSQKRLCDEVELLTALSLGAILRPDLLVFSPLIFSFLLQLICQGQGTSVSCFQLHFATHCSMCVLGIKDQQLLCNLFMIMKDLWEIEFLYKSNDLILNLDVHN